MQLQDLVQKIDDMTDDQLMERLKEIRHRRTVIRPAAKKIREKAGKKEGKKKSSKVDALLKNMTPDQIKQLLLSLGEGE